MQCGADAGSEGLLGVTIDFSNAWPGVRANVSYNGRSGSSMAVAGGCSVSFEKWYVVKGATTSYYRDPTTTLPTAETQASGMSPGWEDWDGDGEPGVTGTLTGAVAGRIHVAPRFWSAAEGVVPDVTTLFRLTLDWGQEDNVMKADNPFLMTASVRSANPALHYVELAPLGPDQATGDDTALCDAIVQLAPMLTPEAASIKL